MYAPFVVKKLMAGTLAKDKRQVGIRIRDGSEKLYDELVATEADFDPAPMFRREIDLTLYGRVWKFDIWSGKSFRAAANSSQPLTILVGGLFINCMLLALFLLLTKANRNAVHYADSVTHELQLEKARLERSNADLEQFAYVASHDLQEPLRMVGNFTQLLQKRYEGQLDEKADSYINYAVDGVKRMQQLLTELLSYSRVGSQGAPLAPTDSEKACRNVVQNLRKLIDETGAQIDIGPLPEVQGDYTQLCQVFQNLIGNAIKFQASGQTPHIEIKAGENSGEWSFTITDNGIGMDPQYHEKIFVMFQRLHTRDAYPGTGVGLAICKKIVIRHGGRIWVDSAQGAGSTFGFTLAKAVANDMEVPLLRRESQSSTSPISSISRRAS